VVTPCNFLLLLKKKKRKLEVAMKSKWIILICYDFSMHNIDLIFFKITKKKNACSLIFTQNNSLLHQHLFSDEVLTIAQGRTTCHSHGMITALANQNDQVIQSIPDGLKSRPTFFFWSQKQFHWYTQSMPQ